MVDALRGFAVAAILLVHSLEHFIYNRFPVIASPEWASFNQAWKDAFFFLFAGKSYTIFALLFGFTYAVQLKNCRKKGGDFSGRFAWRMLLLALFASVNAVFFPGGDILLTFAFAGLVMIPFRHAGTSVLVTAALFFLLQPLEWGYAAYGWMHPGWEPPHVLGEWMYPALEPAIDRGSFWAMAWANLTTGQAASFSWGMDAGRLMQAPGLFLAGFLLGRDDYFSSTKPGNDAFWVRVLLVSLAGAFIFYAAQAVFVTPGPVKTILTMWHNVCFSGIWVAGFALLYRAVCFRKVTAALNCYGKMSLSNYVGQSIAGSLVFFPYGLGLASSCGYVASFAIGVMLMVLQILFCRRWLATHRYGPLEGLWRHATWWRLR